MFQNTSPKLSRCNASRPAGFTLLVCSQATKWPDSTLGLKTTAYYHSLEIKNNASEDITVLSSSLVCFNISNLSPARVFLCSQRSYQTRAIRISGIYTHTAF